MLAYVSIGIVTVAFLSACMKKGVKDTPAAIKSTDQAPTLPESKDQKPKTDPSLSNEFKLVEAEPKLDGSPLSSELLKLTLKFNRDVNSQSLNADSVLILCPKMNMISKGLVPLKLNVVGASIEITFPKGLPNEDACNLVLNQIIDTKGTPHSASRSFRFLTTKELDRVPKIIAVSTGNKVNKVSWKPIPHALSFSIRWSIQGSPEGREETGLPVGKNCWLHRNSKPDEGVLKAGEAYQYSIMAETEIGNTGYSAPVSVSVSGIGNVDPECNYRNEEAAKAPPELVKFAAVDIRAASADLTILARNASEMYVTNSAACTHGGIWETFKSSQIDWPLSSPSGLSKVYLKLKSENGVETSCISLGLLSAAVYSKVSSFNIVSTSLHPFESGLKKVFTLGANFFAATSNRLYFSSDRGQTWEARGIFTGINNYHVDGSDLYLATNLGLYISGDQGQTWVQKSFNEATTNSLDDVFVENGIIYVLSKLGVAISKDNGNTWNTAIQNFPRIEADLLNSIVVLRGKIFVGSKLGTFVSIDEAKSWKLLDDKNGLENAETYALEVSGLRIYAICGTSSQRSLCMSADEGNSWVKNNFADLSGTHSVNNLNLSDNRIYVGSDRSLFYSTDAGKSWNDQNTRHPLKSAPRGVAVTRDSWLIILDDLEILTSRDGGLTLQSQYKYFKPRTLASVDDNLFVSSNAGLYVYSQSQSVWNYFSHQNGLPSSDVYKILKHGHDYFASTSKGLAMSKNNFQSWVPIQSTIDGFVINDFAVLNGNLYIATGDGLSYSSDLGLSWMKLAVPSLNSGLSYVSANGVQLVIGTVRGAVYFSNDLGGTWTSIQTGITQAVKNVQISGSALLTLHADNAFYAKDLNSPTLPVKLEESVSSAIFADPKCFLLSSSSMRQSDDHCLTWAQQEFRKDPTNRLFLDSATISGNLIFGIEKVGANDGSAWLWKYETK